jgi:integrase
MTKTAAREKLRGIIVKELGIVGDGKLTLEGFIQQKWIPKNESQWRPSARVTVLGILKRLTDKFSGVAISDIDSVMLAQFLTSLSEKYSRSTVNMTRVYAGSVFAEAVEQDFLRKNPAHGLKMPKHTKPVAHPVLTIPQMQALLKACQFPACDFPSANRAAAPFVIRTREYALLRLLYVVPLRPSELLALKWKDIDLAAATVTISRTVYKGKMRPFTKTTQEGEVSILPVSGMAVDALTAWGAALLDSSDAEGLDPDGYVFPNSDGGVLDSGNYLNRVLQPLAKQAGIEGLTFQQLRRSVATHAQHLGSLKDISSLLRHKAAETAQKYYVQEIEATVRELGEGLDAKYASTSKVQ